MFQLETQESIDTDESNRTVIFNSELASAKCATKKGKRYTAVTTKNMTPELNRVNPYVYNY